MNISIKNKSSSGFTCEFAQDHSIFTFSLPTRGYELDEDQEDQEDIMETWKEVLNFLINNVKTGSTTVLSYNSNGEYQITFSYDTNFVVIHSGNQGGGVSMKFYMNRSWWASTISELIMHDK